MHIELFLHSEHLQLDDTPPLDGSEHCFRHDKDLACYDRWALDWIRANSR